MPGRAKNIIFTLLVILAGLSGWTAAVSAQNTFERLVMPGKLIEGHAKLEADCANCHSPFTPKAQDDLCLKCHKPVAADISEKRGMHGRRPEVTANGCRHCHGDHKGRDANIAQYDRTTFDHTATDFVLAGRHQVVTCDGCHKPAKKFREAPGACVDCHRQSDPHKGQVSQQCTDCHNPQSWSQIKGFDHSKTKFALTGGHTEVACRNCHAGERYKGQTMVCADCHREQDVHKGRNGAKCDSCHKTSSWQMATFDHDVQTKFPLLGKHQSIACEKCHKEDPRRVKVATACNSCHGKDDPHKDQLGKECLSCHGEAGWKKDVKFDHALTRFPLQGKHAEAKCDDCHKSKAFKDAPVACAGCHSDKKTHDGRLGANCAQCHTVTEWKRAGFDHDRQTKFKLVGRHATATCYSCHKSRQVVKATLSIDCYNCHKAQDQHRGAFGRDCGKCHTPATFSTAYIRK